LALEILTDILSGNGEELQFTLRNIPEERRFHLQHGGSPTSLMIRSQLQTCVNNWKNIKTA
jgi:hypothetical protein